MIRFEIPGKPFAKQRPRMTRQGRTYTPEATVSFERTVQVIAAEHFKQPLVGPVRITIHAIFEPAKSWSKKKRSEHMWMPHTQKPDADNISKAIKDALNRIAYADDSAVADLRVKKQWGDTARTIVTVEAFNTFKVTHV